MNVLIDEPQPGIRRLTLNRPQALNALTRDLLIELREAVDVATADRDCRALVLTGTGRGFCVGVDLKAPGFDSYLADRDPIEGRVEWAEFLTECLMAIRHTSLPVIAAVNGLAMGGGLSLALLSDIRIAAQSATFGNAYIRNGLSGCELGTSFLLPRMIGAGRALELMMTGRMVESAEAERIGLITEVASDEQLADRAVELATSLAEHSAFGTAMAKQVAYANLDASSLGQAMLLEVRTQMLAVHTVDSREARSALLDRKKPDFTGYRTP